GGAGAIDQSRQSPAAAGKSYRRIVGINFEICAGDRYLGPDRATLRIEITDNRCGEILHHEIAWAGRRAALSLPGARTGSGISWNDDGQRGAGGLRYAAESLATARLWRAG